MAVAVPTFGSRDERKDVLKLLDLVVAGNASSRLFEKVRSEKGLAYYIFPIGENIAEGGFWAVQAGVAKRNLGETIKIIEREITNLKDSLKEEELVRAKQYLAGRIELLLDRSGFWAEYVAAKYLDEGKVINPEVELKKIEKITLSEVKDLAAEIYKKEAIRVLTMSK